METSNTRTVVTVRDLKYKVNPITILNFKPSIKLSFEGILLHANNSGIEFLELLSGYLKNPAVKYLLNTYPCIMDPLCNLDISIHLYDMVYCFSVVAFKEAGYVGLYGYRTVYTGKSNSLIA